MRLMRLMHRRGARLAAALFLVLGAMPLLAGCGAILAASPGTPAAPRATSTGTVPAQPITMPSVAAPGKWLPAPRLTSAYPLAVSHADPRVAYIASPPMAGGPIAPILRRTDDSGLTWRDLPLPASITNPSGVFMLSVAASPGDTATVFLDVGLPSGTPACPLAAPQAFTGGHLYAGEPGCFAQYVSTDAGQQWRPVTLPGGELVDFARSSIQEQGGHLYALVNTPQIARSTVGLARLAASDDGGATWRYADAPLAARGQLVIAYAAAPVSGGSLLFAVTLPADAPAPVDKPPLPPLSMWRSDDAGGTWHAAGSVPTTLTSFGDAQLVVASRTLLYLEVEGSIDANVPYALAVSQDGGATWHALPSGGAPALPAPQAALAGPLADGSLLIAFSNFGMAVPPDTTFCAWKPGAAALRRVSPPLTEAAQITDMWAGAAGSGQSEDIWAVIDTGGAYVARYEVLS